MIPADKLSERQKTEQEYFNSYAATFLKNQYYNYIDADTAFSKIAFDSRFVIKLLGDVRGKNILDLGCGIGEQAVYLGKNGARVTAVDISDGLLKIAESLAKREKVDDYVSVRNMPVEALEYKDNYFDIVYGREILHHVDIGKGIKEIKRVLKPAGLSIFIEPLEGNPLIWIYRKIAGRFRTSTEKPLSREDFKIISQEFPDMKQKNFYLFSLIIFGIYFIYKRFIIRNDDLHYWMKDIEKGKAMRHAFLFFQYIDKIVLKILPFLKTFCWITVIWCINQK